MDGAEIVGGDFDRNPETEEAFAELDRELEEGRGVVDNERRESIPAFDVVGKTAACIEGCTFEVGVVGDVNMWRTGRDRRGNHLTMKVVQGGDAASGGVPPRFALENVTANDLERGPVVVIQANVGPFRPPDHRQTGDWANRFRSGTLGGVDLFGQLSPRCPVDRRRPPVYVGVS